MIRIPSQKKQKAAPPLQLQFFPHLTRCYPNNYLCQITKMDNPNPTPTPTLVLDPNPDPKVNGVEVGKSQNEHDVSIKVEGEKEAVMNSSNSLKSKKSVSWSQDLTSQSPSPPRESPESEAAPPPFDKSNPYIVSASASANNPTSSNFKSKVETVKGVLGRWGKKVGEASRKAEDLAGNTWQHLKTGPSFADAALGRIAQGTKVFAEGGYEKVFRQTFDTATEEKLIDSFACYLSTSAGPVMGTLYASTAKLAYCSDSPLSYKADDKTEWSYYKVVIPLHQLKAVNPSTSRTNSSEKYIQVISVDNHEFWLMGFLNYSGALSLLKDALEDRNLQSV